MNVLLDTVTFLWLIEGSRQMSLAATSVVLNVENRLFLSAISAWEIHVKNGLGKLPLPAEPATYIRRSRIARRIDQLDFTEEDATYVGTLPNLHRDPFDRALVSQAMARGFTILTPDDLVRAYPVTTLW